MSRIINMIQKDLIVLHVLINIDIEQSLLNKGHIYEFTPQDTVHVSLASSSAGPLNIGLILHEANTPLLYNILQTSPCCTCHKNLIRYTVSMT